MLRIHSETFMPFAVAAAAIRATSSALKRTGTIRPLASPLGIFGRPAFFGLIGFGTVFVLLNDCSLHGPSWRDYGCDVKHRHVALWFRGVISVVHPRVNPVCLRMPFQVEDFDNPIPNNLPLEPLRYRHALSKCLALPPCRWWITSRNS